MSAGVSTPHRGSVGGSTGDGWVVHQLTPEKGWPVYSDTEDLRYMHGDGKYYNIKGADAVVGTCGFFSGARTTSEVAVELR